MPFCPECRDEFEDWVETCPDCRVALVAELPEPEPEPKSEFHYITEPLVTVATFTFSLKAHALRTRLESEGIESFVLNENINRLYPHYVYATGGVLLQVRESDSEKAIQILKDIPEKISVNTDLPGELPGEEETT